MSLLEMGSPRKVSPSDKILRNRCLFRPRLAKDFYFAVQNLWLPEAVFFFALAAPASSAFLIHLGFHVQQIQRSQLVFQPAHHFDK
jgi:hypothetical protein